MHKSINLFIDIDGFVSITLTMILLCQHLFYSCGISTINNGSMRKITLLLFGLLSQNMTLEGMLPFHFTGGSQGEPFLGTGFRFHLWHCSKLKKLLLCFRGKNHNHPFAFKFWKSFDFSIILNCLGKFQKNYLTIIFIYY